MLRCECLGDPSSSSSLSPPISSTVLHLVHRSGELQPAFAGLTHGHRSVCWSGGVLDRVLKVGNSENSNNIVTDGVNIEKVWKSWQK